MGGVEGPSGYVIREGVDGMSLCDCSYSGAVGSVVAVVEALQPQLLWSSSHMGAAVVVAAAVVDVSWSQTFAG